MRRLPFDIRGNAPADWMFCAYLLITAPVLALGLRSSTPGWVMAAHLLLAAVLGSAGARDRLLGPLRARRPLTWEVIRLWYPLLLVPLLYKELPLLSRALHGGRFYDDAVMRWEEQLFGGQPSRSWAAELGWLPLSELLHGLYLSYYFVICVPPLMLYLRGRIRCFQEVVGVFTLTSLAHYLVFTLFPVQGPRYLFPAPAAGGIDQGVLYRATHALLSSGSSQGAAFPSAHVAVSVAIAVACARPLPRTARVVGVVALGIALATVYGGFHYLADAVAGGAAGIALGVASVRVLSALPGRERVWAWGGERPEGAAPARSRAA